MRHGVDYDFDVSIHAPMKGATRDHNTVDNRQMVSIHAPMKGATVYEAEQEKEEEVSIHAPMKGATPCKSHARRIITSFNPRPHEGSDIRL